MDLHSFKTQFYEPRLVCPICNKIKTHNFDLSSVFHYLNEATLVWLK